MKKTLSFFAFFFSFISVFSQQKITISGYVTDSLSNEAIIGANVYIPNTRDVAVTNSFGYYNLTVDAKKSYELRASFVGYHIENFGFYAEKNVHKNFKLQPNSEIKTVEIRANSNINSNETGVVHLDIKDIERIPSLFGETDVIKAFEFLPGVQTGGEGKSGLNVRGGSSDQNLIILDDVPLYYVNHFSGLYSVFNSEAIKNVKLIKGGYPAEYGGRLSSVLDIRMREGNMKKFSVAGSVGVLTSKLTIEGPIKKDNSSFLLSLRANPVPILYFFDLGIKYRFYDTNFKINSILSPKDRIYFSTYIGSDFLIINNNSDYVKKTDIAKWGNKMVALRWNHVFGTNIFSNTILSFSEYRYSTLQKQTIQIDSVPQQNESNAFSLVQDYGLKTNFEFAPNSNLKFNFGASSTLHNFTPGNISLYQNKAGEILDTTYNNNKILSIENAVYAETNYKPFKYLNLTAGLRFSNYLVDNSFFNNLEPRLRAGFIFSKSTSLVLAYTQMHQYIHLLSYTGTGLPSDYWLPATKTANPEKSEQVSVSFNQNLFKNKYSISLESYYKEMSNLIAFKAGHSFSELEDWEKIIETNGTGTAKGVEFLIKKNGGNTTGWLSATYSFSDRLFENLNEGKTFPSKYDRRIDIDFVTMFNISKKIDASIAWTYGSGYPTTLPLERYASSSINDIEQEIFVYNSINSFRMRAYHRLDLALNYSWEHRNAKHTLNCSFYNAYNRQNPYFYYLEREFGPGVLVDNTIKLIPKDVKLFQQSLFPIIPSISYSFKF